MFTYNDTATPPPPSTCTQRSGCRASIAGNYEGLRAKYITLAAKAEQLDSLMLAHDKGACFLIELFSSIHGSDSLLSRHRHACEPVWPSGKALGR